MLLRDFKPADLKTLQAMDAACFPTGVSYSIEELKGFIDHRGSKTWVAEEGDQIAGFLVAQRTSDEDVYIVTIDVASASRRRGVGSALMEAVEKWGRKQGARLISLEAAVDNQAARAFYERHGFERLQRIAGYYDDGTDAWAMTKWIR